MHFTFVSNDVTNRGKSYGKTRLAHSSLADKNQFVLQRMGCVGHTLKDSYGDMGVARAFDFF